MNKYDKYLVPPTSPVLKMMCGAVPPGADLRDICDRMEKVCNRGSTRGAGLAASQIGHAVRLIYVNTAGDNGTIRGEFMVNPQIVEVSPQTNLLEEACLSYPGKAKVIARPEWIIVRYETLKRVPVQMRCSMFRARVVCHEVDHTNGICRVGDESPPDGVLSIAAALA